MLELVAVSDAFNSKTVPVATAAGVDDSTKFPPLTTVWTLLANPAAVPAFTVLVTLVAAVPEFIVDERADIASFTVAPPAGAVYL